MTAAVIGVGNMGRHHARVYKEMDELIGVCDASPVTARTIGDMYKVPYVTYLEQLLDMKPDHVTIAVPTPYHKEVAIRCLEAGCNVLLEKPMADNLDDARSILETPMVVGQHLAVGYIERFNPAFEELYRRVAAGRYGKLTSVNIKRVGGSPQSADNIIVDVMTHDLNLLTTLFLDAPNELHVFQSSANGKVNSAQALLQFGEASATCEANWVSPVKMRTIAVTGTAGHAEVDMMKQTVTEYECNKTTTEHYPGEPLKREISAFLRGGGVSANDALQTLEITLRAAGLLKGA